jgi:hypothetical protein
MDHPSWGKILLFSLEFKAPAGEFPAQLYAIDHTGRIVWNISIGGLYGLKAVSPSTDSTGHAFFTYNPGRYDGIIVLAPIAGGFNDFQSLPTVKYNLMGRFYSARVSGDNSTGQYRIIVEADTCDPDCATGSVLKTEYAWSGTGDYRAVDR